MKATKKASSKKPKPDRLIKDAFTLPLFSNDVTTTLAGIQAKMEFWFHNYECAVLIRAIVGRDHHPTLWSLATLMLDWELQRKRSKPRTFRSIYPMPQEDRRTLAKRAQGATILEPAHLRLEKTSHDAYWTRAYDHLLADIGALLTTAAAAGDAHFFKRWGDVCIDVARFSFGHHLISGERQWQNGEWLTETEWKREPLFPALPQRKLVIEILEARLELFLKLGRIPTNPEVADLILAQRANAKKYPNTLNNKTFVKTVAKTTERLGLSTVVIENKKAGDK